jgi:hypothetical protein
MPDHIHFALLPKLPRAGDGSKKLVAADTTRSAFALASSDGAGEVGGGGKGIGTGTGLGVGVGSL